MHKNGPPWGEGSTDCYETAKYKTKRWISHSLKRHISFFIKKKGLLFMHQRQSRPFARGSSSFPQTKARNDETFAIDDRRHGGVQDIGKKNSNKSAKPEALQGRRKE